MSSLTHQFRQILSQLTDEELLGAFRRLGISITPAEPGSGLDAGVIPFQSVFLWREALENSGETNDAIRCRDAPRDPEPMSAPKRSSVECNIDKGSRAAEVNHGPASTRQAPSPRSLMSQDSLDELDRLVSRSEAEDFRPSGRKARIRRRYCPDCKQEVNQKSYGPYPICQASSKQTYRYKCTNCPSQKAGKPIAQK